MTCPISRSEVAVVIPAHNEADTISEVVAQVGEHAPVIVVNDASTDRTAELAEAAGALVVTNSKNRGYDRTLEAGFREARRRGFKAVITMDADGEHAPHMVEGFVRALSENAIPLVLGVRPKKQRLAEFLIGALIRWRYGVKDIMCGMKGYHLRLYDANNGFDHVGSVGSELAISSIRRCEPFYQLALWGHTPRADQPRFDSTVKANLKILRALYRVVRLDPQNPPAWDTNLQGPPLTTEQKKELETEPV